MIAYLRTAIFALLLLAPLAVHAQPAQFDDKAKAEIERIIHDYLVENPEVLVKAFEELERRQGVAKLAETQAAVEKHRKAIYEDPGDYVAGNPEGDVTLVEFFDYQCGYCKRSFEPLMDFVEKDGNIRLVLKEFPILGPNSLLATKAAIAAENQGRYFDMHRALYEHKGGIDEDAIMAVAAGLGLDVAKLKKDMGDPAIQDQVSRTYRLAEQLGVDGTPAFVVGGTMYPGAVDEARLTEMMKEARGS
jgi:protein-disulfide isomerase